MKKILISLGLIVALIGAVVLIDSSLAQAAFEGGAPGGVEAARGSDQPVSLFSGDKGLVRKITDTLLFIIGVISVFMIIIGGLRFVLSGGDKTKAAAARNTILYAIVGLVIAFFSYAIIDFVVGAVSGRSSGSNSFF